MTHFFFAVYEQNKIGSGIGPYTLLRYTVSTLQSAMLWRAAMIRTSHHLLLWFLTVHIFFPAFAAAEEKKGMPPAAVVVATAEQGRASPEGRFVGSIEFPDVSSVAAEVSGRVDTVGFEEGDTVTAGQLLVRLDNDLLAKELEAAQAQHAQALADFESSKLELQRITTLFRSE